MNLPSITKVYVFKEYAVYKLKNYPTISVTHVRSEDIKRIYNPIDVPGLLTEMLKINFSDMESILNFIHEFGLPQVDDADKMSPSYYETVSRQPYEILVGETRIGQFQHEVENLRQAVILLETILEKNDEKLTEVKEEFRKWIYRNDKGDPYLEEWEKVKEKENIVVAETFLSNMLNTKQTGSESFVRLVPHKSFDDLFQIAWWQLSQAITNKIAPKRCVFCGEPLIPIHGHQKFCYPLPGSKRSRCENTFNQRLKRDKEKSVKLFHEGKSIDNIVQIVNKKRKGTDIRTLENVKEWLNQ